MRAHVVAILILSLVVSTTCMVLTGSTFMRWIHFYRGVRDFNVHVLDVDREPDGKTFSVQVQFINDGSLPLTLEEMSLLLHWQDTLVANTTWSAGDLLVEASSRANMTFSLASPLHDDELPWGDQPPEDGGWSIRTYLRLRSVIRETSLYLRRDSRLVPSD